MKGLENGGNTGKRIGIWIIALGRVEAHASHLSVAYVSALPLFYEFFVNLHVISYKLQFTKMQNLRVSILLKSMRFYAYHGVLPQERCVGGDYEVNVRLEVEKAAAAVWADSLAHTVNYADVFRLTEEEMMRPAGLLEHVAGRILNRIFQCWHQVAAAEVCVRKCVPPVEGAMMSAEVCLRAENPWGTETRLLVLDFDGTLADTAQGIVETMQATFKTHGCKMVPGERTVKETIGLPLHEAMKQLLPEGTAEETVALYVETYRERFEEIGAAATKAYPNVAKTLERIKRERGENVGIAIATSRSHRSVVDLCGKMGLAPYIDSYVAADDVTRNKPDAEPVLKLMEIFGVEAQEVLVVGDTTFDMEMGKAAGCRTCGVTYGNHDATRLAEAGATALADDFTVVAGLIL